MNRIMWTFAFAVAAAGASAQTGPVTFDRPCAASRDIVVDQGAAVLTTGPGTYDRYVKDAAYCLVDQYPQPAWVPSSDNPQCFVGYRCRSGPNDW